MTWAEHHGRSEEFAAEADSHRLRGDAETASLLYARAAECEMRAVEELDPDKQRTLGITAISAVALWHRAGDFSAATRAAYVLLSGGLPAFAQERLRELLQILWSKERESAVNVRFIPGDVLVSVKGGLVVYGGAPLDLILRKVEEVKSMFYRTAEWLLHVPHRQRGLPSSEVQQVFQPWLFQAPPGSYQFAVRIQEPAQTEFFPEAGLKVSEVVETFLEIIQSGVMDPNGRLAELVPDPAYQATFLRLTRNLSPTGGAFEVIEFRDAEDEREHSVALSSTARKELNKILKERRPPPEGTESVELAIHGVLRALHLDEHWLEVITGETQEAVRVVQTADVIEDVVGPLVNRPVVVDVLRDRTGRLIYRDIESAD